MSTHGADLQLSPPTDTLSSVGEVEALKRIFPRLPAASGALLGPGDDAAVVAAPDARFVVTTDMMIHGPDFRLAWSTPHDLGWKAAITNLADVAAMGAVPSALVVAIAAPLDTPVATLEGIADGLRDACAAHAPGTGVVGGDLSVSNTLTLAVTAFGSLEGRKPVVRSGAAVGDTVAVAGELGRAGAGIWLLFAEGTSVLPTRPDKTAPPASEQLPEPQAQPDAELGRKLREQHPELVEAQLAPTSPLDAGRRAGTAGATAMLDVSDGLILDAGRIALASGVSIEFLHDAIEAEAESLRALDPVVGAQARDFVLCGGEDHAMLATFSSGAALPEGFRMIGVVTERTPGHPLVTVGGEAYVRPGGWDPFSDWNGATG
ncbi:thiamine-phosphate kinase [Subtercola sp. RTI3]|uniref:thiamine-phosphate kinase n=1 Tax=Subtercola sp. RTI3 TaxID=3048639 RepID=UPI002B23E607|nr:thiamine-phosphate kinase [Subtercola sp. RTI3]MEA9985526.1 thiamine-phosphate kinase [Subtercola sp. RTI3]